MSENPGDESNKKGINAELCIDSNGGLYIQKGDKGTDL